MSDPWPKTELAKSQLEAMLSSPTAENLLSILKSEEKYPDELLPNTGLSISTERELSAQLIRFPPDFGTVSSSAVLRNIQGQTLIRERSFDWDHLHFRDKEINF